MKNPSPTDPPGRKCHCSGNCGPAPSSLSRRQFLEIVGVSSAAAFLANPAWAVFELPPDQLEHWKRKLFAPASPLRYLSDKHTDARMHLGGIGTGNFEIGSDGQLTTWQLFNTLRDGHVPFYFLIKTGSTTKLLQTRGGPDWPKVKQIEMTGEYPFARLRFLDADLPIDLELTALSPFAPLDSALSSTPLAAFTFRIQNKSNASQEVSLAALMQNPVGYEADGENLTMVNPCFGGNLCEGLRDGNLTGLVMRAMAATEPILDEAVTVFTLGNLKNLKGPPADRPEKLHVEIVEGEMIPADKLSDPARTVVWLEDAPPSLAPAFLNSARDAVKAGTTLLFTGRSQPLLHAYASWTGGKPVAEAALRPDIIFEDFENGYEKWQVEGEAFGKAPARGTLPNQQQVSGFLGHGLVNTYLGGDNTKGRLISKSFQIEQRYIRFLVGGGRHEETQVRLLVDGKVVKAAAGKDNERLEPAIWDVSALQGQTAHLEIVDAQTGGWGHINVDQIEFSDLPGPRELLLVLEELLPARFSGVRTVNASATARGSVEFENLVLQPDSTQVTSANGLQLLTRPVGKGKVIVADGLLLDPSHASLTNARRDAYTFLCALTGATYSGSPGIHPKAPGYGTLALGTLAGDSTIFQSGDDWAAAWNEFNTTGRFSAHTEKGSSAATPPGRTVYGGVASTVTVPAGATIEVPFLLAWHYPNKYATNDQWMGCHYAERWPDAAAVLRESGKSFQSWRGRTERFRKTFYDSTLPYWLLDCVTANAAILRHIGIVFRIANGDVYGWEGSNGCCDPTCTHVWGYEQTFARLFPDLEKEMRRIDFKHQQRPDGGINNRTEVPSPPRPTGEQPFADGHASCILKAYREALNHPDETFFNEYWPSVKRAVEYLIGRDAQAAGGEPSGVLQDDQWNTYDEALHGVTTFISGYYLAALRAGEEWARRSSDASAASRFHEIFEKGQTKLVEFCWNGEYFQQHLSDYAQRQGEVGPGCMADQLIGQWWAHQLGLGYILPVDKVVSSLRAIFKHNFKSDLTNWKHAPRPFAGAGDKGLIICTWPKGGRPPGVMLYSDEVWTGIEYQVASHLIYEGLVEEGFAIVKAARERYDGIPRPPIARNPWNEIECGGHYARAMSSWSLLLALSGWHFDAPRGALRFAPQHTPHNFQGFFTGPEGWGNASQSRSGDVQTNEFSVMEGRLMVKELNLQAPHKPAKVETDIAGRAQTHSFSCDGGNLRISFTEPAIARASETLRVRCSG